MILLITLVWALEPVTEDLDGGAVDWTALQITATARGTASTGALSSRSNNEGDALSQLGRRMLDLVPLVRVSASETGKDILGADDVVADRVDERLSAWQIAEARYLPSGVVELDAALALQPLFRPAMVARAKGKERPPVAGGPTGLVIDARDVDLSPAIAPRVEDPSGGLLYGVETMSDYTASQRLPVVYVRDPADVAAVRRAGAEPLFVHATAAVNGTDLVVSAEDAARVRGAAATGDFLLHANVVVVAR